MFSVLQVKYHFHSQQEIKNLTSEEGIDLSGKDPDFFNKDMINVSIGSDLLSATSTNPHHTHCFL